MKARGCNSWSRSLPTYASWRSMISRCTRKKDIGYKRYGGRGIKVCQRWMVSFADFLKDMGPRPRDRQLGRTDNDGNYEPGNCKWVTRLENSQNKSTNKFVVLNGERMVVAEAERRLGIYKHTLLKRMKYWGWPDIDVGDFLFHQPKPVGIFNPGSKFTENQVLAIREMNGSSRDIAKQFGVEKTAILNIRRRATYYNIP